MRTLLPIVVTLLVLSPVWSLQPTPGPRAVVSLTLMTDEFIAELLPLDRIRAFSRSVDDPVLSSLRGRASDVKGRAWLDLETLVALQPDLILAADWSDAGALEFLKSKGYSVAVVKTPRRWSEVKDRIRELGVLLARQDSAQNLLDRLGAREKTLKGLVSGATVLEYSTFGSSMAVGTLWNDMVTLAGFKNLAAGLPTDAWGYAPLSREMLVKLDPDWLVLPAPEALTSYGQGNFLNELRSDPLYRSLRAVKNGHVLFLSEALKTSTSHMVLGAAEALQHAAYPNLR